MVVEVILNLRILFMSRSAALNQRTGLQCDRGLDTLLQIIQLFTNGSDTTDRRT
jgi:hypothetical protein